MLKFRMLGKLAAAILVLCGSSFAVVEYGIAQRYPYDQNIQTDPDVFFVESFEEGAVIDLYPAWLNFVNAQNLGFSPDHPAVLGGSQSFQMNGLCQIMKTYPGVDTIYMRLYTKFKSNCDYYHHWIWLGGQNPPTATPMPMAGSKPISYKYFNTGVEPSGGCRVPMVNPGTPQQYCPDGIWRWDFYTYWWEMNPDGHGDYWGNSFNGYGYLSDPALQVPREQWICVEVFVKMNTPVTSKNGEQAFWINGEKKVHIGQGFPTGHYPPGYCSWIPGTGPQDTPFPGFQWRSVPELNLNNIWVENELVGCDSGLDCTNLHDNIVLAKKYIGPAVTGTGPRPTDIAPPAPYNMNPKDKTIGLPVNANISLTLKDFQSGVDQASIKMTVNGAAVQPTISGTTAATNVLYNPSADFGPGEVVRVTIEAQDLYAVPNKMKPLSYSFTMTGTPEISGGKPLPAGVGLATIYRVVNGGVQFDVSGYAGQEYQLELFDTNGKRVWYYKSPARIGGSSTIVWDRRETGAKPGLYIARLTASGTEFWTQKFAVVK